MTKGQQNRKEPNPIFSHAAVKNMTKKPKEFSNKAKSQHSTEDVTTQLSTTDVIENQEVIRGCKLFVEGLPYDHTPEIDAELAQLCKAHKAPGFIRLVKKKGYGFGYLVFKTEEWARKALTALASCSFQGRYLRVEVSKEVTRPKKTYPGSARESTQEPRETHLFDRQILLMNLPRGVNDEIIHNFLEDILSPAEYAAIQQVRMSRHQKAFVDFMTKEDTDMFLATHAQSGTLTFMGAPIEVLRPFAPGEYHRRLHHGGDGAVLTNRAIANLPSTDVQIIPPEEKKESIVQAQESEDVDEDPPVEIQIPEKQIKAKRLPTTSGSTHSHTQSTGSSCAILMGGLSTCTTPNDIRILLNDNGMKAVNIELILSRLTKGPSGIARIRFDRPEDVMKAIQKLNAKHAPWGGGCRLVVEEEKDIPKTEGDAQRTKPRCKAWMDARYAADRRKRKCA